MTQNSLVSSDVTGPLAENVNFFMSEMNFKPSSFLGSEAHHESVSSGFVVDDGISVAEYVEQKEDEVVDKVNLASRKGDKKIEGQLSYFHVQRQLKSYLHSCINSNMLDRAHAALLWHRYKFMRIDAEARHPVIDTSVYNIMIKGWAVQGKLNRVKELLRLMELSNTKPNLQTYACYLLCLWHQKTYDADEVNHVLQQIQERKLPLSQMFVRSNLNMEQRSKVRKIVHKEQPQVKFASPFDIKPYEPEMLHSLPEGWGNNCIHKIIESNDIRHWYGEQVNMESSGYVKIKSVYQESGLPEEHYNILKSRWNKCELEWRHVIQKSFERNLNVLKNKMFDNQGTNLYPYLTVMNTEQYVDLMMNEIFGFGSYSEFFSPPISVLQGNLGRRALERYLTICKGKHQVFAETAQIYSKYLSSLSKPQIDSSRVYCEKVANQHNYTLNNDIDEHRWPPELCSAVGKFLYDIILNDVKIDTHIANPHFNGKPRHVPIFFTMYKTVGSKIFEEMRVHPAFLRIFRAVCTNELRFEASVLPMVVPPMPWINTQCGGYLITDTTFIRDAAFTLKHVPMKQLHPSVDAINYLSLQPWKINHKILDLMIQVFRNKGDESLDIPLHQSTFDPLPKISDKMSKHEKMTLHRKIFSMKRERAEMYSLWCDCLYKLSIANHVRTAVSRSSCSHFLCLYQFRDRIFWFPHNFDFRGRVYVCPPHFNHLGSDLSRAILLFANGKPLGPRGLDWLKIHLVNLTGFKKQSSMAERVAYANEMMPKILDSADRPFDGEKWWTKSDEPWQTLACCCAIADAVRSPNPEEHICHFPVHQDGSCNGLQHYAALGRDQHGAEAVNLEPSDRPQDVYTAVANLVERERKNDADANLPMAVALAGFVQRKVVKQTVMTFVYGVTKFGARLQIFKRLKDIKEFPRELEWSGALYLMHKVFLSIQEMFTATRMIQHWFNDCANALSHNLSSPVKWVTPLGFPVSQPYRKELKTQASCSCCVLGWTFCSFSARLPRFCRLRKISRARTSTRHAASLRARTCSNSATLSRPTSSTRSTRRT